MENTSPQSIKTLTKSISNLQRTRFTLFNKQRALAFKTRIRTANFEAVSQQPPENLRTAKETGDLLRSHLAITTPDTFSYISYFIIYFSPPLPMLYILRGRFLPPADCLVLERTERQNIARESFSAGPRTSLTQIRTAKFRCAFYFNNFQRNVNFD